MTSPTPTWLTALRDQLGERVLFRPQELLAYAYDGTFVEHRPAAVVLPRSTQEVAGVLRLARDHRLSVVTRGAGTSLTGGPVAVDDRTIVMSLARMNRIIAIDAADLTATVEAGVVTADLRRAVERRGLMYPPDPASLETTTIGGNLACNAGGPQGLKYGVTRHYALGLEIVLPSGDTVWTGSRTTKLAVGYPLTQLLVGSEGTLGVITRAILKLLPRPPAEAAVLAGFTSLAGAAAMVTKALTSGCMPAAIELIDDVSLDAVASYEPLGLPPEVRAVLLFRLDGSQAGVDNESATVAELAASEGAAIVRRAAAPADIAQLWRARRAISPALARVRPNKLGEDIVVPRGRLVELVDRIARISERHRIPIAVFGHISDGNLHPNLLFDAEDAEERGRALRAASDLFAAALDLGGSISGEHGIGILKKDFVPFATDPRALELMLGIKRLFDPEGMLNPSKVFPDGLSPVQPSSAVPAATSPFEDARGT